MTNKNEPRLCELADRLISGVSEIHMRGEGDARFLYVVGNGRSAEVSLMKDAFWVEFWDSLDEDAQPVAEAIFGSTQSVEDAVLEHLAL